MQGGDSSTGGQWEQGSVPLLLLESLEACCEAEHARWFLGHK